MWKIVPTYSLTARAMMSGSAKWCSQGRQIHPQLRSATSLSPDKGSEGSKLTPLESGEKNCAAPDAQQLMHLWQLLWGFNDVLSPSDDGRSGCAWSRYFRTLRQVLVVSRGRGPQKEEQELDVLRGLQDAEQGDKEGRFPPFCKWMSRWTGPGVWFCLDLKTEVLGFGL